MTRRIGTLARVVAIGALVMIGLAQVGSLEGWWTLTPVLSGSMAPGMPTGSLAVAEPVDTSTVRAGDVLLFVAPTADRSLIAHRVHRRIADQSGVQYETKGDANSGTDPWRLTIVGKRAWRVDHVIPALGWLVLGAGNPGVRLGILTFIVVAFAAYCLRCIWRPRHVEGPQAAS